MSEDNGAEWGEGEGGKRGGHEGVGSSIISSTNNSNCQLTIQSSTTFHHKFFWEGGPSNCLLPQMDRENTSSAGMRVDRSCLLKSKNIPDFSSPGTNPFAPQITCNCGRPPAHVLKKGLLFSNVLILREITLFLKGRDLLNFKDAFCNFSLIESFVHDLTCIHKPFKTNQRCNCIHRAEIITI